MKRVIILAYDFPPYVSVGGLRPYAWFKYLHQYDIYPIVITRQWQNKFGNELDYISEGTSEENIYEKYEHGEIIRTPYKPNISNKLLLRYGATRFKFPRKIITGFHELFQFIIPIGPKKIIHIAANKYLEKNKADAIIATGEPFVLFHYANKLSVAYNIPWIGDYRDPWSQNISRQNKPLKIWNTFLEKRVLRKVNAVFTVSQFVADKIALHYPKKIIHIVPNGFDPKTIKEISKIEQNSKALTISYAGTIYNWHPIEAIFKAFDEWLEINQNNKINLDFYGVNDQANIEKKLSNHKSISKHTTFHKKLPNKELLNKLIESNVLLLFNDYSIMGTKIYDYLGLRRKILFCFTNDIEASKIKEKHYNINEKGSPNKKMQSELIKKTNSGIIVKDTKELKEVLTNLVHEFKLTKKIVSHSKNTHLFSRKLRAKELSTLIKETIDTYK